MQLILVQLLPKTMQHMSDGKLKNDVVDYLGIDAADMLIESRTIGLPFVGEVPYFGHGNTTESCSVGTQAT